MANQKKQGKFQQKKTQKQTPAAKTSSDMNTTKSPGRTAVITAVSLCVFVGILACILFWFNLGFDISLPGKTFSPGVTIAGVDVGGLKKSEAVEAVSAAIGNSYETESMTVTVLDKELLITPADSGASFDVEGAVAAAFRTNTAGQDDLNVDIVPYLNLNADAIRNKIAEFGKDFPTEGIPTGSQILQETVDGQKLDVLEVTIGTVYYDFSEEAVYQAIRKAYNAHRFTADYTCNRMDAAAVDLDALYAQHCIEPVSAALDPETLEVSQSVVGYRFDLDQAKEALLNSNPGDVLKFPFMEIQPDMDTETLKSMLFRDELSSYEAYQSSSYNRATNLRLACEALNGIILLPGDEFSYNKALGERTAEKGYLGAASYLNGETVTTLGGGICQPSSALYMCTLYADLEIVERTCHSYPSSYVPLGMDATVSWGGPDFRFKNNTAFPIRIDAVADGGKVIIKLIGTETKDYYVKMEYEVLGVSYPKTIEEEVEPGSGHKDGEVKTTAYTGYTVQSYKLKYDRETDELISREKESYSVYSKRDKVVYRVKGEETKPTETTEPKPTETKPTKPKPTETKPTEPKPTETKPTEPKPTETEPTVPKPTETEPTVPKPTETEPTVPEPTEPEPTQTTPPETTTPPTTEPTSPPTEAAPSEESESSES